MSFTNIFLIAKQTNSRLKLDRLFWQYGVNINVKRFLLIIETSWNSFLVTHNISTYLKLLFEVLSDAFMLLRGENMKVKCLHIFPSIMTPYILA